MFRSFLSLLLLLTLAGSASFALAENTFLPHMLETGNLEQLLHGHKSITVNTGLGVVLMLSAPKSYRQDLTLTAAGRPLVTLEGGRFLEFARLENGGTAYWAIAEFTGGAHCCGQYHLLAQAPGQPVRYLGHTAGYNGGPMPLRSSFLLRGGRLYCRSFDNRFDYFHASHAASLLVNVPRTYYLLSPTALTVHNGPFKERYIQETEEVENKINRRAVARTSRPEAILQPGGALGLENLQFSDNLGQMLVKRTILLLYAREDHQAWERLEADVPRYYQTGRWLPELRQEIQAKMQEHPY